MSAPNPLFSLAELEAAAELVHRTVPPTPQYAWPLLAKRSGCEVWVKHENHTPTCGFKVRGGIVYMDNLKRSRANVTGLISATRGNHGQSIAFSASRAGIPTTIYVPRGNSTDQNAAMRAFGASVVEFGRDFDEALAECHRVAREENLHFILPLNQDLIKGVATYALELFRAIADLDTVYVPIGIGSGICGLITVRDLLGLKTEVVGVVADKAPAIALSFAAGKPIPTESAQTFADGMATRDPRQEAVTIIKRGAARVLRLSEDAIAEAVRAYFEDTHNVAEGAGAAPLAALLQERARMTGKRVAVILTGGNIDSSVYRRILAGETPKVG
jgi:threonine dehydratase